MSTADHDARTVEIEVGRRQDGGQERRRRTRVRVPVLTVLHHPDFHQVGRRLWMPALQSGGEVEISRSLPAFSSPTSGESAPLGDPYLSRTPIRLSPVGEGGVRLEQGTSSTEIRLDGEPVTELEVPFRSLERGVVLELSRRVVLLLHTISPLPKEDPPRFAMVGESEALLRLRQEIERVADLEVPVLLRGPTGTGKELGAHAIHRASRRRDKPLVCVNMAAIPATLAASELFGAVRGAFTGSDRTRRGYFRKADGGTIFLDEVGEAPPEVQVMLLRVLETGEIQSVGAADHERVDVRVLAATDQDLEEAIDQGSFRAPLLHRLAGFTLRVPALTERRDDLGRLLVHFLEEELTAVGEEERLIPGDPRDSPWLPASIVARLARYHWPGNIRELRNVTRQLVIASRGAEQVQVSPEVEAVLRAAERGRRSSAFAGGETGELEVEESSEPGGTRSRGTIGRGGGGRPERRAERPSYRSPSDVDEDELVEVLRRHRWTVKPAADELGISRASLYNLMERSSRVRKASDLSREEIEASRERTGGSLEALVEDLEVSRRGLEMRMKDLGLR